MGIEQKEGREPIIRKSWILIVLVLAISMLVLAIAPRTTGATLPTNIGDTNRPNIIVIVVDALRADHVSAYGYERPTTPHLDAFMADGVRFAEATSVSPWTLPSNAALLTGRLPSRMRVRDWASLKARLPEEEVMLAEVLRDAGYQTTGIVSAYFVRSQFGFSQGFDHYQITNSELAEMVNQATFDWLDANQANLRTRPQFLLVYYYDPHTWYDPPPPYDTLYDSTYTGPLTADVYQHGQKVVSGEIVPTARDIEHLIALYDGEITYWDAHLGRLFERLSAEGLLDNSLVLVTSDHGQMFGEHGKWVHRNSLYEEVLRVPFFLRLSNGMGGGMTVETPVSHVDIFPTVLDLAGLPVPAGLDGTSLRPLLEGEPDALADRPVYAEMHAETDPQSVGYWIAPRHELRSVKTGGWKYILEFQYPAGDALYQVQPTSLYEPENLIADYPDLAGEFYDQLYEWFRLPTHFDFLPSVLDQ